MKIEINLPTDVSVALRRMAAEDRLSHEEAATVALRDWLIAHGYLDLEHELDEDTEVAGSA